MFGVVFFIMFIAGVWLALCLGHQFSLSLHSQGGLRREFFGWFDSTSSTISLSGSVSVFRWVIWDEEIAGPIQYCKDEMVALIHTKESLVLMDTKRNCEQYVL